MNSENVFGRTGWICPVCGRGMSPYESFCPCTIGSGDISYSSGSVEIRSAYDVEDVKLSYDQFVEKYCHNCGSQRCEGIGTERFEGCAYKEHLAT